MALACTLLGSGIRSSTDGTNFNYGTTTPTANAWVMLFVMSSLSAGGAEEPVVEQPTWLVDPWQQIYTEPGTDAEFLRQTVLIGRVVASPSADGMLIGFLSTQDACHADMIEITGAGDYLLFRQPAGNFQDAPTPAVESWSLDLAIPRRNNDSIILGSISHNTNVATNGTDGETVLRQGGTSTPSRYTLTEFKVADDGLTASWTGDSEAVRAFAVELIPLVDSGTFPATDTLDTFDRANGALGSNWSAPLKDGDVAPTIFSNGAVATDGSFASAYWNPTIFPENQEAFMQMSGDLANSVYVIELRTNDENSAVENYMHFYANNVGAGEVGIMRNYEGFGSELETLPGQSFTADDQLGGRVFNIGVDIIAELYLNGILTLQYQGAGDVDSFPLVAGEGHVGFTMLGGGNDADRVVNNFGGGETGAAPGGTNNLPSFVRSGRGTSW